LTPLLGGASIAKSITIEGGGAAIVGRIIIANSNAIVILRGLHLNGGGTIANGIRIDRAAAVHIEDCTVERYASDGISLIATSATRLFVSNTAVHANGSDGLHTEDVNALAEIENSRFEGNSNTGLFLKVAKATVLKTVASGNVHNGIQLRTQNAKITETMANDNGSFGLYSDEATAKVEIEDSHFGGNASSGLSLQVAKANVIRSVASGNAAHGIIQSSGSAEFTETTAANNGGNGFLITGGGATLASSVAHANSGRAGLSFGSAVVIITDCVFTHNDAGIYNAGTLYTRGNNTLNGNVLDYTGLGTKTSATAF
jgi:hypothetical protein